jgi:uncharacterized integral membrane protein
VRIVFWILTIPFLAAAGAFAAANHQPLTLKFWPLPFEPVVPAYAAVLGAFFMGLLLSGLWFWSAGLRSRLANRRQARRERALEQETARLRRELAVSPGTGGAATSERATDAQRLVVSGGE